MRKINSTTPAHGRKPVLLKRDELELVEAIKTKANAGFPMSKKEVMRKVEKFIQLDPMQHPQATVGEKW